MAVGGDVGVSGQSLKNGALQGMRFPRPLVPGGIPCRQARLRSQLGSNE